MRKRRGAGVSGAVVIRLSKVGIACSLLFVLPGPGSCDDGGGKWEWDGESGSRSWGEIESFETFIEVPGFVLDEFPMPSRETVWRFVGMNSRAILDYFQSIGLPEDLLDELKMGSKWFESNEVTHVLPSGRAIREISPECRARIYGSLRRWEENRFHHRPFVFKSGTIGEYLSNADLPERTAELIEALSYPLRGRSAFSDLPFLLRSLETEEEERGLIKALTRTRSLMVRIRLEKKGNRDTFVNYWSSDNRHPQSRPLLRSLISNGGVEEVDLGHLLPPHPRKHLFMFPTFQDGQEGRYPDSLWMAFNFFEFLPREVSRGKEALETRLNSEYDRVTTAPGFGDLILFRNRESNRILQGGNYIAEDIIYTKFDGSTLSPWILTRIPQVLDHLTVRVSPKVEVWRRRNVDQDNQTLNEVFFHDDD